MATAATPASSCGLWRKMDTGNQAALRLWTLQRALMAQQVQTSATAAGNKFGAIVIRLSLETRHSGTIS